MKIYTLLFLVLSCACVGYNQQPVIVSVQTTNIRESPSLAAPVVGKVTKGKILQASTVDGDWVYVTFGKLRGWVYIHNIKVPDNILKDTSRSSVRKLDYSKIYEDKWIRYESSVEGSEWYNGAKMTREGSVFSLWMKTVDSTTYRTVSMIFAQIDCRTSSTRTISGVTYYPSGTVKRSWDTPSKWSFIVPETVVEALKKHCVQTLIFFQFQTEP